MGHMVQEILSHDGDVLKFAGDAFIAVFRPGDHSARETIEKAIDTAILIQQDLTAYETDVGVTMNGENESFFAPISSFLMIFSIQ